MKKFVLAMITCCFAISAIAQSYYVAGNGKSDKNGSFCDGYDWTTDVSLMSGTPASITFANVAAGSYKFKVTNGTWNDPVWGFASYNGGDSKITGDSEDNVMFTLTSTSDVTITFNGENITAVTFAGGGITPGGTYYVAGNGGSDSNGSFCNGFDWSTDTSPMSGTPATITFTNVGAGTYKFKVTDGTWNDPVFGFASYTGSTPVTSDTDDNIVFTLTEASDVTIVFNGENITALTFNNQTSINEIAEEESNVVSKEYYTLQGIKLQGEPTNGVLIVKTLKADGSVINQKIIR